MLWPFDLLAATDQINHLHIDVNGNTQEMKSSQAVGLPTRLRNFHTFGCTVYILNARLQGAGGGCPPKWDPRSRLGIYLSHSPSHAGNVALVLNPKKGLILPQFHAVFDDDFSTVPSSRKGEVPDNWKQVVQNSRGKSADGFYDVIKKWFDTQADPSANSPSPTQDNPGPKEALALPLQQNPSPT